MSAERHSPAVDVSSTSVRPARRGRAGWVVVILAAAAHALLVWQAVEQYTAFRDIAATFGRSLRPGTLAVLIGAIVVPVMTFVLTALATRGRRVPARILVVLAALGTASALSVGLATLLPMV